MKPDISALQYMRAHGHTPGPTQRPLLTGVVSGLVGWVPSSLVAYFTGALVGEATAFDLSVPVTLVIAAVISVAAGMLYAAIFQRAANDTKGGWLFGSSYGFLIWMIGPVGLWRLFYGYPLTGGTGAMGMFAAYVVFGLALGVAFPLINRALQKRFRAL